MIRPVQADDLPFLEEMLYEAAAAYNPEVQAMGKEVLLRLAVPRYLANWGVRATRAWSPSRRPGSAWAPHGIGTPQRRPAVSDS
jgi:hypothetical protein